jgi:hypothetical protein
MTCVQVSIACKKMEELADLAIATRKLGYLVDIREMPNSKTPFSLWRALTDKEEEKVKSGVYIIRQNALMEKKSTKRRKMRAKCN